MRSQYPQNSDPRAQLLAARARAMRFSPTESEALLFSAIRGRRLGVSFRRQVPIGQHVVDFLAPSVRLVIEVDGDSHLDRQRADAARDRRLRQAGYTVLRLEAELIMRALPVAVARIRDALMALGVRA